MANMVHEDKKAGWIPQFRNRNLVAYHYFEKTDISLCRKYYSFASREEKSARPDLECPQCHFFIRLNKEKAEKFNFPA